MSKIRLHGSSSGYMEIAPPAAGSSETITLPNSAGEVLLSDGSAASLTQIPAANIVGVCTAGLGNASGAFGQGITMADQWRLTTSFDSSASDIDSNWERVDTGGFGQLGTGMSQSSGIFTFPSTGIYRIDFQAAAARASADSIRYVNLYIKTTTNGGSSFTEDSYAVTNIHNTNHAYASGYLTHIFDVTDVSTHKVKFFVQAENTLSWLGSTNTTNTGATFVRLGDT